jgi:hypothetical protein
VEESSKASLIRLGTGGRLDFWSLDNDMAGRSRGCQRIAIDEAGLAKNGDNSKGGSLMAIWERSITPTLYDYGGRALVCSNAAGKDLGNFFYNLRTPPTQGASMGLQQHWMHKSIRPAFGAVALLAIWDPPALTL